MSMKYAASPIYTDAAGRLCFCPECYPMLVAPERMHLGHFRRDWTPPKDVYERGILQPSITAEAVTLEDVPGALVYELVREPDGRFELCDRNGHTAIMLRLRYSPDIEIRDAERSLAAD